VWIVKNWYSTVVNYRWSFFFLLCWYTTVVNYRRINPTVVNYHWKQKGHFHVSLWIFICRKSNCLKIIKRTSMLKIQCTCLAVCLAIYRQRVSWSIKIIYLEQNFEEVVVQSDALVVIECIRNFNSIVAIEPIVTDCKVLIYEYF